MKEVKIKELKVNDLFVIDPDCYFFGRRWRVASIGADGNVYADCWTEGKREQSISSDLVINVDSEKELWVVENETLLTYLKC
jgi:hypothetical protein